MTDRLVQEHAGPAGTEHHSHRARGCGHGFEIHQRLTHRLARERVRAAVREQLAITVASAAASRPLLPAAVAFGDHLHIQTHQWAHVGRERAICSGDQHRIQHRRKTHHHLIDPRIEGTAEFVHFAQKCNFFVVRQRLDRIQRRIQRLGLARAQRMRVAIGTRLRDRARRSRRSQQFRQHDFVGIGEAGFLATHRAHANALLDRMITLLDNAVFEQPRLAARMLEVQIGRVDGWTHQTRKHAIEIAAGKTAGLQQLPLGQSK